MTKHIQWDGQLSQEGFDILKGEGGCIVCPTKVGYIIMTSDKAGLERKFEAKERNRNKPGVVLCGSMDELRALAQLNPEIEAFYQKHCDDYVASIQPDKTIETRYEQGVMVSMVDAEGKLIPEQGAGSRSVNTCPVVIRKGLDIDKIMMHLSDHFNSWNYRQGEYY